MSFFRREETRSAEQWQDYGPGSPLSTKNATGLVPYYASIRHIVDFMSTLPIDAYRKDGDVRTPVGTPQLLRRLDDPGDIGVGTWIGQWAFSLAVHGNAVGWITDVDGYGYPTAVRWLSRDKWNFEESTKRWYVGGEPVSSQRIVHCPWIVPDGKTLGLSPLDHFREFWRAGLSAQQYADVGRGGGLPPAILKNTSKTLKREEAEAAQSSAVRSFASGKPWVSGNDWDLTLTTIPPNQAQFLQTLQLTANQTAAIFGLDPREIGGSATESLTYATDESRSLNRANNMRPYLVRFENMTARLLPERQFIRLNVDATIRTDIKTRIDIEGAQLADGRLSLNEIRELEDRPPVPGGDFHNVPAPSNAGPSTRTQGEHHD